jgi:Tol biopolymer transport system component
VGAAAGRTLSALEPDGTPRWSISAGSAIKDPRWSPSGFRIAYRAGHGLRVVDADGDDDRSVDADVYPTPPAWFPFGLHLLAYLDGNARLRIADPDGGSTVASASASPGAAALAWAPDGSLLLERSTDALWVREVSTSKLAEEIAIGAAQRIPLPAGAEIGAAAFSPHDETIAVLLRRPNTAAPRSEVLLVDPAGGPPRRLFAVSGQLSDLTWSPDGRYLLVAWPDADQWLFLPVEGRARIKAVEGIATAFAPGSPDPSPFPRVEGWCCSAP